MFTVPAISLEYVRVPVGAENAGAVVNPTSDAVHLAFVGEGATPASGDWKAGDWETDASTTPDTFYARCTVGTGGAFAPAQPTDGEDIYDVWVWISDNPEAPRRRAGSIRVI